MWLRTGYGGVPSRSPSVDGEEESSDMQAANMQELQRTVLPLSRCVCLCVLCVCVCRVY